MLMTGGLRLRGTGNRLIGTKVGLISRPPVPGGGVARIVAPGPIDIDLGPCPCAELDRHPRAQGRVPRGAPDSGSTSVISSARTMLNAAPSPKRPTVPS